MIGKDMAVGLRVMQFNVFTNDLIWEKRERCHVPLGYQ